MSIEVRRRCNKNETYVCLNTPERYCYREQLKQMKQFKQQYATHIIQCNLKCNLIQYEASAFVCSDRSSLCYHSPQEISAGRETCCFFFIQPTPHCCSGSQSIQQKIKLPNNILQTRESSRSAIVLVIVIQDKLSSTISFSVKSNVFAWTKYSALSCFTQLPRNYQMPSSCHQ